MRDAWFVRRAEEVANSIVEWQRKDEPRRPAVPSQDARHARCKHAVEEMEAGVTQQVMPLVRQKMGG